MTEKLLGKFSYIAAVFAAAVLVAWKMPKRRMFTLRAVLSLSLMFVLSFLFDEVINVLEVTGRVRGMLRTVNGFCVFLFASAAVKYCFECNLWAALFAGTAGYSMQHISRRLYDIAVMTADVSPDIYAETAILVVWTPVVYIVTWLIGIRKHAYDGVMTDNKLQIIIALCVVIVSVFLNSYAKRIADAGGVEELGIYIYLFSVIISALSLLVEFMMLSRKRAETERDVMKQLMSQEREQFALEKTVVETINIKCHDLKHQLSALESKLDTSELEKIRSAVDIYDSSFKTGNLALDVVLSMKSLLCERKNIKLTCMADGMALSFMSDTDIYSLFGNILDNAIEAVEGLDDEERRVICITISRRNGMVFVHEENYYSKRPRFKGGLPQTTKEDKAYHGYGMLSISSITEQYGGDRVVGVDGGVFYLDIMFPRKGTV